MTMPPSVFVDNDIIYKDFCFLLKVQDYRVPPPRPVGEVRGDTGQQTPDINTVSILRFVMLETIIQNVLYMHKINKYF